MKTKAKQIVTALVACAMSLALTACGGSGSSPPTETPTAPTITTQPANQSAVAGQTATFSVAASGSAPFTYQWKKNGIDIAGATNSIYTTSATSIGDSGALYSVVVSNSAGTATSSTATLTVSPPVAPAITTQPANQSSGAGQTATFSVVASGSAPFTYQWKKNDSDIAEATSSTYTTPAISSGDNGAHYSVVVSNSAGTVTSHHATLSDVAITTQPAALFVYATQTASFSVTATGTGILAYQWKKNGNNIAGATSSSYTTPATTIEDNNALYSVVVSNSAGTVTSSTATLAVSGDAVVPAITTQPTAPLPITAGQTATFSVAATGTSLNYQWKKNGVNITGGTGATNNTYTTPAMGYAGNGAEYSVVISNSAGSITSSSATLTVNKISTPKSYGLVANANDGFYDKTECVQDNNTGLVWEGKTASPATSRLGTSTYTNYDSTSSAQKWNGIAAFVNPTQAEIDVSTNSIGYKNSVNTSALCGYTDWRMPTKEELQGILASSGIPQIDTTWFPNTQASWYWTSSPYVGSSGYAWYVYFHYGYVGNGYVSYDVRGNDSRDNYDHVRLVR